LGDIVAASVAVPTVHHLAVARPLIEAGVAVLIEKPLAPNVADAEQIAELAARRKVLVQVGHTERFNPAVQAVERLGVRPKFIETHRISPFTFRSADVGVVFDMMIHDIDILLHLMRDEVVRVDAVGVNVLGPHEDIANARVSFRGGAVANLTASRLALKTSASCASSARRRTCRSTIGRRSASPSRATRISTCCKWRANGTCRTCRKWPAWISASWCASNR